MNLHKPPNDYLAQIDLQLKNLEKDKEELEKKYGFEQRHPISEKITIETLTKKKNDISKITTYRKNQRRYNIEKFDEKTFFKKEKPLKLKPEISAEWVCANKIKPDLKTFYNEDRFSRQMLNDDEFGLGKDEKVETEVFDNFMESYSFM